MSKRTVLIALTLVLATLLGCDPTPAAPTPTATSAPPTPTLTATIPAPATSTPSPRPTATPSPTPTPAATDTATPSATPTATATLSPSPTSTPRPDPASYLGVTITGGSLGQLWNVADVRLGTHPDRARFVLEMKENQEGAPRFEIIEVDNDEVPFPQPTGELTLDPSWGEARIDLIVSDLYAFDYPLADALPIEPGDDPLVLKVGRYATFDDALLGFSIGLRQPAAYEVQTLQDPARIVVDVFYP